MEWVFFQWREILCLVNISITVERRFELEKHRKLSRAYGFSSPTVSFKEDENKNKSNNNSCKNED